ncbi:hypothetical protein HDU98_000195 [Podochytrium sp. JEL0797]|nr:hypothetical protein HDU98_000195 [Podochytrium sp. JEL0797]
MGLLHKEYIDDSDDWVLLQSDEDHEAGGKSALAEARCKLVVCASCDTHLSTTSDILSKSFQGARGKAYLFNRTINVCEGNPETRTMTTGLHVVRDISCKCCRSVVGWKYDKAFEESQKYKEGRFIIEVAAFKNV